MPRTAIAKVSRRRSEKRIEAVRLERDGANMTIEEVNAWLPQGQCSFWPQQQDVDDASVFAIIAAHPTISVNGSGALFGECWLCGRQRYLDICHIVSRSDELANLFLACTVDPRKACYPDSCHARLEKPSEALLRAILRAKLEHDKPHTSYLRVAQLRRERYTI